jgi:catechol 2,3-dioxygenase-like lactoylglutathione lyase family enzyme
MTPTALRLERIGLNVADLDASEAFYAAAFGFARADAEIQDDAALAALLGARRLRTRRLRRGAQLLELTVCEPPGAPYPAGSRSNDVWFQHCALATDDMPEAYRRLCRCGPFEPISRHAPQALPGGIVAYKFRDPDGHPLELIGFPHGDPRTERGIDHSAIAVADAARSSAFYRWLGLAVQSRQVNTGPAQDSLDGLDGTVVEVVALAPAHPAPHVELLAYHTPRGRRAPLPRPTDIAASRLVFAADALPDGSGTATLANGGRAALLHDPDGHAVVLLQPPRA